MEIPKVVNDPRERIFSLVHGFQMSALLVAACELDLFTWINSQSMPPSSEEIAAGLALDNRAVTGLLRALACMGVLISEGERFRTAPEFQACLDSRTPETVVPAVRHWGSCMRQWSQLAWTIKTGVPAPKTAGILGPMGDYQSFLWAMNSIGQNLAGPLVSKMINAGFTPFKRLLDLGGATGTYAKRFLECFPEAAATIFDLPIAINEARDGLKNSPLKGRIELFAGDFYKDPWPAGFDCIWISAIIHQQNESATAAMFQKAFKSLVPAGRIAIRDVFFNRQYDGPPAAALFAVNMIANTGSGMVYTEEQTYRLLQDAGFQSPQTLIPSDSMGTVIVAEKP